jgi:hypothetical protein
MVVSSGLGALGIIGILVRVHPYKVPHTNVEHGGT